MKSKERFSTTDVLKEAGVKLRELALWENTNRLFNIERNPKSKNRDRVWNRDHIKLLKWVKQQFKEGLSSDAIRILIEYYQHNGRIESVKWYE